MNETRLILTCGLPAAGKTALATRLASQRRAVRLTRNEWLWALGSTPWDRPTGEKIERELWRLAQEILRLGLSVVLDFGLWARIERDEMRRAARDLGVGVELHYLEVPVEELYPDGNEVQLYIDTSDAWRTDLPSLATMPAGRHRRSRPSRAYGWA